MTKKVLFFTDRQGEWLLFDADSPEDVALSELVLNYLNTLCIYESDESAPYLEAGPDSFKKMELLVEEWESLLVNQELLGIEFVEYYLKEVE